MLESPPVSLASPLTFTKHGAKTVEQESEQNIEECAFRVAVFPEGYREDLPEYGIPDLLFSSVPLDLALVEEAIRRWEPRAELESSEMAAGIARARDVIIEVG